MLYLPSLPWYLSRLLKCGLGVVEEQGAMRAIVPVGLAAAE